MNVVFTGPYRGGSVPRHHLAEVAERYGYVVQEGVRKDTNLLISSRTDTGKASKARRRGIEVITYDTFDRMLGITAWEVRGSTVGHCGLDKSWLPVIEELDK